MMRMVCLGGRDVNFKSYGVVENASSGAVPFWEARSGAILGIGVGRDVILTGCTRRNFK
jgi:hypothetical protein